MEVQSQHHFVNLGKVVKQTRHENFLITYRKPKFQLQVVIRWALFALLLLESFSVHLSQCSQHSQASSRHPSAAASLLPKPADLGLLLWRPANEVLYRYCGLYPCSAEQFMRHGSKLHLINDELLVIFCYHQAATM